MDRISVTFITKNRHGFFLQAFSSLLAQTFKDFDVIIIDDSDESIQDKEETRFLVEIAKHGHNIKFITGENLGITQAWQRGLEESNCELGYRMEDDIYLMPDYLENLYSAIIKDENIAAVGGLSPNIFHHTTIRDEQFVNDFYIDRDGTITPDDKQCCLISNPKPVYYVQHLHGLFVYRKSLVQNVGGFATWMSPKGHRDETDLTLRLYRAGYKLVVIPAAVLFHAEASQGGSRDRNLVERNQMNEMDEAIFQQRVKSWMSTEPKLQLNIRR